LPALRSKARCRNAAAGTFSEWHLDDRANDSPLLEGGR
jgi:hypothetical protein